MNNWKKLLLIAMHVNVQKRLSLVEHKLNDRRQDWKLDVLSAIVLANSCLVGPGIVVSDASEYQILTSNC